MKSSRSLLVFGCLVITLGLFQARSSFADDSDDGEHHHHHHAPDPAEIQRMKDCFANDKVPFPDSHDWSTWTQAQKDEHRKCRHQPAPQSVNSRMGQPCKGIGCTGDDSVPAAGVVSKGSNSQGAQ